MTVADRLQQPSPSRAGTVLEVWQAACQQVEAQLDRASFATWFRDALLVDYEPASQTLIVVVPNAPTRAALDGRLRRTILRILGDGFGHPVAVHYLLRDAWIGHELAEKSAMSA